MINDAFKQFVDQKVAEASEEPINLEKEKNDWLSHLEDLHVKAISWLKPYVQNHGVHIDKKMVELFEEQLGNYQAPVMTVKIGKNLVELEPMGTFLIGARGRVDIKGPKGVARLVIVPKESTGPGIRVNVVLQGQTQNPRKEPAVQEWVWKLASSPPRITYTELTEESFLEALMGVTNG